MRLLGSTTSPYVRRVRVVLHDLKIPFALVDVFEEAGQAELRAHNPLWKVPTLDTGAGVVWDTRVILEHLHQSHGPGSLRVDEPGPGEPMLRATVDELLGTLIKLFYLRRDGLDPSALPYLVKDEARARSTLKWLEGQLRGPWCSSADGFGLSELALYTALDWIVFREVIPLDEHRGLRDFLAAHSERPLLVETAPSRA